MKLLQPELAAAAQFAREMQRRQGAFEIHLAAPEMSQAEEDAIVRELEALGISKNKYFLNVYNVPVHPTFCLPMGTPPTGHDLVNPQFMSTQVVTSLDAASVLVRKGMAVFKSFDKKANFEIEKLLGKNTSTVSIDVGSEFPGFVKIDDSPEFENHLVFRGTQRSVPAYDQIVAAFQKALGIGVHQIVDFTRTRRHLVDDTTAISRVATIYQPSRIAALDLAQRIEALAKFLPYDVLITEQVCLVAEHE